MNSTPANEINGQEATTVRRDYRQEVTNQIIEMLEKGTAPWQKPWDAGSATLPFNPTSERNYRGGNALHLMATAARRGFTDPRWLTYRQAQENGWQVRQGEKGTQIEYWQFDDRSGSSRTGGSQAEPDTPGQSEEAAMPGARPSTGCTRSLMHSKWTACQLTSRNSGTNGRSRRPASRSSKTRARASPTTKATEPSTAVRKTPSTFPRRTPSGRPQTTTEPLSTSWRTGPDIPLA